MVINLHNSQITARLLSTFVTTATAAAFLLQLLLEGVYPLPVGWSPDHEPERYEVSALLEVGVPVLQRPAQRLPSRLLYGNFMFLRHETS